MNLLEFKQLVKGSVYEEPLAFFKNWMIINYNSFLKSKEIYYETAKHEYEENHINYATEDIINMNYYDEVYPNLKFQWDYFSFYGATEIYSKMGWALDDNIEKINIEHHEETDSLYIDYGASEIFSKINDASKDVAEFFYAIVLLKNFIIDTQNREGLYILKEKILEGIHEFRLLDLASQIVKNNDVFVAMSFSKDMQPTREAIKEILTELKYNPVFIDEKQHNNLIPEEIFLEINKSHFVIADLTQQKGGVYLEAGYAMAKKKNVIFLCASKEKNKIHFDIKQINTIFWKDTYDLKKLLKTRIQATIQN